MQSEFGKLPSTPQSPFLNNLPTPVKAFIRPMLFASVGLHALLIFLPLPGEKEPPKPAPEKTVKVTQLPPASKPNAATAKPLSKVPISARLPRPVIPAARPDSITIPSTTRRPIAQPASEAAAANQPAPSAATGSDANSAQTTPAASNPFADFPRYPNAKPGSFESLSPALSLSSFQTSAPLATVETFFMGELPKKGFETGSPEKRGSVEVISVTKGGVTKYLHLITRDGKGTVYLLLDTPIDVNSLPKDAKIETEPPEKLELNKLFTDIADNIELRVNFVTSNSDTELKDPTSFAVPGIEFDYGKVTKIPGGEPFSLAELDALLQPELEGIGFTLTASADYGGAKVYQITKNSYTRYLAIAPTNDGGGWVYVFEKAPGQ